MFSYNMPQDQLKENLVSYLHKNIKRNTSLTEAKKLSIENYDLHTSKSSSSPGGIVVGDYTQHHSIAPTLPIHSPHSPLLATKINHHHLKETQLSARYINNTKKSAVYDYIKSDTISSTMTQMTTSTTLSSKLLCYCEKSETELVEHHSNKISLDSATAKRSVPTRNASTSPHLDVRKLGSMTKLTPSPSLSNELCINAIECKINKLKSYSRNCVPFEDEGSAKATQNKNKSLSGSKPLKILRTTRSLSPRPPQNGVMVQDSSDVNFNFFCLPEANNRINKKHINKLCRSEQSFPNVIDGTETNFFCNESTNRSTGYLDNSYKDPWLKNICFDVKQYNPKELNSTNTESKNTVNPWIKRADIEIITKISRHELFRQPKSFAASKFDSESIITDPSLVNGTKSSSFSNQLTKSNSIKESNIQLQSAPTSPQFLTTAENSFVSSPYLTTKQSTGCFVENTPKRSVSFSPARIKNSLNPFRDCNNLHQTNSPPPLISVATEIMKERNKNKSNTHPTNYGFLNVCNPNLLTTRHSFCSVSNQGEELHLNIRRLSDQMRRKEPSFTSSIKTFSSDRNVREKRKDDKIMFKSPNDTINSRTPVRRIYGADFSEYLEQFRCSEAKKAALGKEKLCFWKDNLLSKTTSNQTITINKTQQSSDCLLETTC